MTSRLRPLVGISGDVYYSLSDVTSRSVVTCWASSDHHANYGQLAYLLFLRPARTWFSQLSVCVCVLHVCMNVCVCARTRLEKERSLVWNFTFILWRRWQQLAGWVGGKAE